MWMLLHKLWVFLSRIPAIRLLVDNHAARKWRERVFNRAVRALPDRRFMERDILTALVQRAPLKIMFVGCEPYTAHYESIVSKAGNEFWTADINPASAACGSTSRHFISDICTHDARLPDHYFDVVLFNGVFGYGVNDPSAMVKALHNLKRILKSGGSLMIGWNTNLVADPTTLDGFGQWFEPSAFGALPMSIAFSVRMHRYDWFRAIP